MFLFPDFHIPSQFSTGKMIPSAPGPVCSGRRNTDLRLLKPVLNIFRCFRCPWILWPWNCTKKCSAKLKVSNPKTSQISFSTLGKVSISSPFIASQVAASTDAKTLIPQHLQATQLASGSTQEEQVNKRYENFLFFISFPSKSSHCFTSIEVKDQRTNVVTVSPVPPGHILDITWAGWIWWAWPLAEVLDENRSNICHPWNGNIVFIYTYMYIMYSIM